MEELNDNIKRLVYEYDPTYRNIYRYKVLNEFEMSYFIRSDEWRQNKQDPNIIRIKGKAIVSLPNNDIHIPSCTYMFASKRVNLKKY